MKRPIRVVVFACGPFPSRDIIQFLDRLEAHAEIELLGVFFQSVGKSFGHVWRDLRRRRGLLAGPLLTLKLLDRSGQWLRRPVMEWRLRRRMIRLKRRIHFVPDLHASAVLAQVRELAPDLGLIYGAPILKPILFEIPPLGTLGIHHGQAPAYRGKKTTFWAMYNGEQTAGVMIQKINAGLDTGQIVRSGTVRIGRRTYGAVMRDVLALGLDLYLEAILQTWDGTAVYKTQPVSAHKLYRDPKPGDILRFWLRRIRPAGPMPKAS